MVAGSPHIVKVPTSSYKCFHGLAVGTSLPGISSLAGRRYLHSTVSNQLDVPSMHSVRAGW